MPGGESLGPLGLYDLAADLLQASIDSVDEIPTWDATLAGAPERSFVSPGVPVWDCCEQLIVHIVSVNQKFTRPSSPGEVGQRHRYGAWLWEAEMTVTIGRCVPEGEMVGGGASAKYQPPSPDQLNAASAQINADGWALANGLANRMNQGLLSDKCSSIVWNGVVSAEPMGGCGGWRATFRFGIDGYGASDPIGT